MASSFCFMRFLKNLFFPIIIISKIIKNVNFKCFYLTFYKKYDIIKEKWPNFRPATHKDMPFGHKIILHHIYYIIFFIKNQINHSEYCVFRSICHEKIRIYKFIPLGKTRRQTGQGLSSWARKVVGEAKGVALRFWEKMKLVFRVARTSKFSAIIRGFEGRFATLPGDPANAIFGKKQEKIKRSLEVAKFSVTPSLLKVGASPPATLRW